MDIIFSYYCNFPVAQSALNGKHIYVNSESHKVWLNTIEKRVLLQKGFLGTQGSTTYTMYLYLGGIPFKEGILN